MSSNYFQQLAQFNLIFLIERRDELYFYFDGTAFLEI